jgi:hypothetical protein
LLTTGGGTLHQTVLLLGLQRRLTNISYRSRSMPMLSKALGKLNVQRLNINRKESTVSK